jgi:hypothetical protein
MGMDLLPRNRNVESMHFNWTGWRSLAELLHKLGADVSEMSGSNNGDLISHEKCQSFARILDQALEEKKINTVQIKDDRYVGGSYGSFEIVEAGKGQISEEDREWILEAAEFFAAAQGCEQR